MRKLYTIETVAKALPVEVGVLAQAIKDKRLAAVKIGGKLYLEADEAGRYAGKPLALGAAELADTGKADDWRAGIPERLDELTKLCGELAARVTALEAAKPANAAPKTK